MLQCALSCMRSYRGPPLPLEVYVHPNCRRTRAWRVQVREAPIISLNIALLQRCCNDTQQVRYTKYFRTSSDSNSRFHCCCCCLFSFCLAAAITHVAAVLCCSALGPFLLTVYREVGSAAAGFLCFDCRCCSSRRVHACMHACMLVSSCV